MSLFGPSFVAAKMNMLDFSEVARVFRKTLDQARNDPKGLRARGASWEDIYVLRKFERDRRLGHDCSSPVTREVIVANSAGLL